MSTYRTPGVYIEEISKFPPSVAAVETAIPAFIGYTEKAEVGAINYYEAARLDAGGDFATAPVPIRITSLLEYEEYFGTGIKEGASITVTFDDTTDGDTTSPTLITRTVRAEINPTNAATAFSSLHNMYYAMQAFFANGGGPCYVVPIGPMDAALTPGTDGAGFANTTPFENGIDAVAKVDEVTLFVIPEAIYLANMTNVWDSVVQQCVNLQDRFGIIDVQDAANITTAASDFRNIGLTFDGLKYSAAYYPYVETTLDYLFDPATVNIAHNIDGSPRDDDEDGTADTIVLNDLAAGGSSEDLAMYNLALAAVSDIPLVLPPSPLVAGQYARVDSTRGVWKAPANVSLATVVKPTVKITNAEQDDLNVHTTGKSINAIRTFTGKGTLIWGARTLDGNSNEWRYVPVRRFFNFAEESIKKATEQFVFEPNDANTWTKVRAMIENFLVLQWRAGALQGAKPEQAFFVKVGLNETMTALDILEGRMIVEIGMAVVRPAEFIILKFSHKMAEA